MMPVRRGKANGSARSENAKSDVADYRWFNLDRRDWRNRG
jgi:hypothetical protein